MPKLDTGKQWTSNQRCWKNWMSRRRRTKLDLYLSLCAKPNSEWIGNLNVKPEAPRSWKMTQAAPTWQRRGDGDKWDFMKLRSFYTGKERTWKRGGHRCQRIPTGYTSDRGRISGTYKKRSRTRIKTKQNKLGSWLIQTMCLGSEQRTLLRRKKNG